MKLDYSYNNKMMQQKNLKNIQILINAKKNEIISIIVCYNMEYNFFSLYYFLKTIKNKFLYIDMLSLQIINLNKHT